MKKFSRLLLIPLFFSLSGCFNIFHFVGLNDDGTLSIRWRFTMSRALMEMSDKKNSADGPSGAEDPPEESLSEKLENAQSELSVKWKGKVKDLVVKNINSENDAGIDISFNAKPGTKLEEEDQFNLLPEVKGKKIIFTFAPDKKEKKKSGPEGEEGGDPSGGQEFENIGKAILSSARYQIYLSGFSEPVKATMINKSTGKSSNLQILKIGTVYLVEFPFMSLGMDKSEKGHALVVDLK